MTLRWWIRLDQSILYFCYLTNDDIKNWFFSSRRALEVTFFFSFASHLCFLPIFLPFLTFFDILILYLEYFGYFQIFSNIFKYFWIFSTFWIFRDTFEYFRLFEPFYGFSSLFSLRELKILKSFKSCLSWQMDKIR